MKRRNSVSGQFAPRRIEMLESPAYRVRSRSGHMVISRIEVELAEQRLNFCRLTQDGDDEGCLHLDRLPTKIEASAIREALGIRKRRHLSPASTAQVISALGLKQSCANSPSGGPAFVKKHVG
jgi:hypothetical protein